MWAGGGPSRIDVSDAQRTRDCPVSMWLCSSALSAHGWLFDDIVFRHEHTWMLRSWQLVTAK
jgi:hypothetical protein